MSIYKNLQVSFSEIIANFDISWDNLKKKSTPSFFYFGSLLRSSKAF